MFDEATSEGRGAKGVYSGSSSGVDYDMLRQRDAPILFFDEIVLYQDDLEDCGEVVFEVSVCASTYTSTA